MNTTADPVLAVAVRAARRAGSVIIDASRDLRRLPTFSKEHGDIVACLERKDANRAETVGRAHVAHARERLEQVDWTGYAQAGLALPA